MYINEDFSYSEDGDYGQDNGTKFDVVDGKMIVNNTSNQNLMLSLIYNQNISCDFCFEINYYCSFSDYESYFGVYANYTNEKDKIIDYFMINKYKRMYIINSKCDYPFAEVLSPSKYLKENENNFKLLKKNNELHLYINDKLIYRNDYLQNEYSDLGIIIPKNNIISLSSYSLYLADNSYLALRSAVVKEKPKFKILDEQLKDLKLYR